MLRKAGVIAPAHSLYGRMVVKNHLQALRARARPFLQRPYFTAFGVGGTAAALLYLTPDSPPSRSVKVDSPSSEKFQQGCQVLNLLPWVAELGDHSGRSIPTHKSFSSWSVAEPHRSSHLSFNGQIRVCKQRQALLHESEYSQMCALALCQ